MSDRSSEKKNNKYVHVEDIVEVQKFTKVFLSGNTTEDMSKDILQQLKNDGFNVMTMWSLC